jgi:hypothetical protein
LPRPAHTPRPGAAWPVEGDTERQGMEDFMSTGLQAVCFFLAFALPISVVGRIDDSGFQRATRRMLAVIAVGLGALPLLLVDYTGAFLQLMPTIRLVYLGLAILIVAVISHARPSG